MLFNPEQGIQDVSLCLFLLELREVRPLRSKHQREVTPCWGLTLWLGGEKGFGVMLSPSIPPPLTSQVSGETCWWQGWCIHGRGEDPSGNPPLRVLGGAGVVMGELSQLWGSPLQPCRVPGRGRAGAGTGGCCYSSHAAGRISASAINHHVGRAWVSSNCFYLHNEARLSILLIFERGKSKSALDKQLPPTLPSPCPPLLICAFSPGFFPRFLVSSGAARPLPGPLPVWGWVLGVLPLSPGPG